MSLAGFNITVGLVVLLILIVISLLTNCVAPTNTTQNSGPAGAPQNNNLANTAPPQQSEIAAQYANVPVTLPALDALLADESFVSEIRSTLSLSDEEIQKLRDISRNAVLNLSEEEANGPRSTRSAFQQSKAEIQKALGQEKAAKFIPFIQERLAGQDLSQFAQIKPSEVPTDTRIVVNTPAYRMDIFENGNLTASYKVGIGYPEFPLPTGLRKADKIIFNPTWTPPDEPWVKGKFQPGKKVEAGSKDNPLGLIKVPIGLPNLIHGGKAPAKLGTFASHGCVGLTNDLVQDFAMRLSAIADNRMSLQEVKSFAKNKTETEEVKLNNPIPVELRYETIVVENGKLKIYRDVYEYGTNTEENLRRVLETFDVSLDQIPALERENILNGLAQMASDAAGRPIDPDAESNRAKKSKSSKVTRNIKGQKELEFVVAGLEGKGYPAPVNLQG